VTSPDIYAPRDASAADVLAQTRNVVDAILRNNPLVNAVVPRGLAKWIGNYTDGTGSKINFLWIGEFLPADPYMGGAPQRGFSLVRDDSQGGVSAIALFDGTPGAGPGLRQTLTLTSGDGSPLLTEARNGGRGWPFEQIAMNQRSPNLADWPATASGTYDVLAEGRFSGVGNTVYYRFEAVGNGGGAGDFRVHASANGLDAYSATHSVTAGGFAVFDSSMDIATSLGARGDLVTIWLEARRTNGAGTVGAVPVSMDCHTA
jgi:hypothetical protein